MKFVNVAALALLFGCSATNAAYTVNIVQSGPNVVATGSGTQNLTALAMSGSGFAVPRIEPTLALVVLGNSPSATGYVGMTGPSSFGTGPLVNPTTSVGDSWAINGNLLRMVVPTGYVSGSALNSTATWNGTTIAGLGLTPGIYIWTWGVGPTADSITVRIAPLPSNVTATKTVSGSFTPGGTATYTVVLNNTGLGAQPDNPGNEFTDVLPAGVTLVSATASSGTAVASVGTNTVTWNGSITAASTVTVTINATVNPAPAGTVISNQGSVSFDGDADGTNETTVQTDDPAVVGAANPTSFTVAALPPVAAASIPTLSEWALIALASIMALFGLARTRRG